MHQMATTTSRPSKLDFVLLQMIHVLPIKQFKFRLRLYKLVIHDKISHLLFNVDPAQDAPMEITSTVAIVLLELIKRNTSQL
jgi:hypothetical protein